MQKYISEFIDTFTLVFCGTGAIIINDISNGTITHVGIAIWACQWTKGSECCTT